MAALLSQFQFTATFNQKVPRRVWFGVGARNWQDFSSEERSTKKKQNVQDIVQFDAHTNTQTSAAGKRGCVFQWLQETGDTVITPIN